MYKDIFIAGLANFNSVKVTDNAYIAKQYEGRKAKANEWKSMVMRIHMHFEIWQNGLVLELTLSKAYDKQKPKPFICEETSTLTH